MAVIAVTGTSTYKVNAIFVYGTNDSNILWQNVRIEELLRARPASFLAQRTDNETVFGRDYDMEGPNKHDSSPRREETRDTVLSVGFADIPLGSESTK